MVVVHSPARGNSSHGDATPLPKRVSPSPRGNEPATAPSRKAVPATPLPPYVEGYGDRQAALEQEVCDLRHHTQNLEQRNEVLSQQVQDLTDALHTMQQRMVQMEGSLDKVGDAALHPTLDEETKLRLGALESGLQDLQEATERQRRAAALAQEHSRDKGDSVLLVAHVPAGPGALDLARHAVMRTGCDSNSIVCVTQMGPARLRGSASSVEDRNRAAAAAAAAASSSGGETAGAGPSRATGPPSGSTGPPSGSTGPSTHRITCLVRVKVPEVRAHVLKNKKNLKQQRDVGGVYIDPYFSKPGDLRIYKALKTKEGALRKQNTPCRWVGPLALQQRINGAWVPVQVPPPPPAGAPATGSRRSNQGRQQDYPPPPAAPGSGGTASQPGPSAAAATTAATGPAEGERRAGGNGRGEKERGSQGPARGRRSQEPSHLP